MPGSEYVPKKNNDTVELDFTADEREFKGTDANPIDAATGESLFDDLSPRFVRNLDAAVEKVKGKPVAQDDEDLDEEETDEVDQVDTDEDEDEDADGADARDADTDDEEADAVDLEDEDADEPTRGRRDSKKPDKFDKRLARADRMLEETRAQLQEMQARETAREAKDKLAADEREFNTFKSETEGKLNLLKKKLAAAIENGETTEQVDLNEQISDLKADLRSKSQTFETAKKSLEEAGKRRGASAITIAKANQWKRRNPRYESDAEFREVVNGLDRALASEGSNPESDDHYAAIDKRLRKLYPELAPRVRQKTPVRKHPSQQQAREGSPGDRRQAGDAKVTIKGGKVKISPAKLARVKANMSRFGLDPTDPKELKEYILNNPGL